MLLSERLQTFAALGDFLRRADSEPELTALAERAYHKNNWFTPDNTIRSLRAIADKFLTQDALTAWVTQYGYDLNLPFHPAYTGQEPRAIGVVMAGNIPAVGFHDLLCVLVSGHKVLAKLSSQDFVLIHYLIQKIKELNPAFTDYIQEAERLNAADAFIATGSDNTARYFDYYFGKKPHIIRRNRSSVALLMGEEQPDDFVALGHDLSDYYGLGCRNVSTLLVPEGPHGRNGKPEPYDFVPMLRALEPNAATYLNNHKYQNNYDYNKSIYLINGVPHFDNGYLLVTENAGLVSPISVVYYQTYKTLDDATQWLTERSDRIQVVASAKGWYKGSDSTASADRHGVAFGQTQCPSLTDYADGVDTMAFLKEL
ncbi:aldehyde dehydrogenase family protein [Spirosoma rhododendri]|uniref:Acyl-CoA reductase n=1 Tax=Spirosoma rhododendri TaxID=2728024 RepID=A0A7L5DSW6_9BACT|nr:acyl-CoA reductase [Spirosoma rhododendri]QJD79678.1 acyl-CoA reductase [Spirosoma rhododendri]